MLLVSYFFIVVILCWFLVVASGALNLQGMEFARKSTIEICKEWTLQEMHMPIA